MRQSLAANMQHLTSMVLFPHILKGRMVFEQLKQLESKGVKLQIAVNTPQTSTQDTTELAATGM